MTVPRDFNEEIVSSYYEMRGYFVRMNVPYQPAGKRQDLSDVDIVAVHPLDDSKCIACEVKGWHTENFTMAWWKHPNLLGFTSPPATSAVRTLVGDRALQHVLVIPPLSKLQKTDIQAWADDLNVELLERPDLIREMLQLLDRRQNARNSTDHVFRVLLNYEFLNPNT